MPKVSVEYEQQQRDRIIQGAAQVFAEKGFRQTTIDDIARHLKLSKGAIYIYFKSKDELFFSVCESFIERRITSLYEASQRGDTVLARLENVLDQFITILTSEDFIFFRLGLESHFEHNPVKGGWGSKDKSYQLSYQLVYSLLEEGQRSGELKAGLDVASISTVILATCDGLMLHTMVGNLDEPQAVRRAMWNTYYNLLKA